MWIMNWQDDAPLRADSIIGYADAAMKLLYYSRFFDDGLRYDESDQIDTLGFHLVPFDFAGYPTWEVQDPSLPLTAVFTDPKYFAYIGGNKLEPVSNAPSNSTTTSLGVLRTSSYQRHDNTTAPQSSSGSPSTQIATHSQNNSSKSFQELLAEGPSTGLASNDSDSFYITAIFEPEEDVHPVPNVANKLAIVMEAVLSVDPEAELLPARQEFVDTPPPSPQLMTFQLPREACWYTPTAQAPGNYS
jgi:hypothetical protein